MTIASQSESLRILSSVDDKCVARQGMTGELSPFPSALKINGVGVFVVDPAAITTVHPDIIQDDVPQTEESRRFALSIRLSMM